MILDCTTCGACCASPRDTARLYRLGPVDRARDTHLPRYIQRMRVVDTRKGTHLETVQDEHGERCYALGGVVGKRVSCSIYAVRPTACQVFEVGGEVCLRKRAEVGIGMTYTNAQDARGDTQDGGLVSVGNGECGRNLEAAKGRETASNGSTG